MERENIKEAVSLDKDIAFYEERINQLKKRSFNKPLEIRFSNINNRELCYDSVLGKKFDQFIIDQMILAYEHKCLELKAKLLRLK